MSPCRFSVGERGRSDESIAAEVIAATIGLAFAGCAIAANQNWLDRHFLPSFFLPRHWYVVIETAVRVVIGAFGLWLAVVARRRIGRFVGRTPARTVHIIAAALLALGMSELVLRRVHLRPTEWLFPDEEPRRRSDPRLGWMLEPERTGHSVIGERRIDYAIDRAGYRVRRADEPTDADRPTVVFAGESMMFGEGLTWEETVPAQVGAMLGIQSANLAVHGYSSDQMYLRLDRELPRFRRPVAVVALFMTALFGRNLDDDRPQLGPGLEWRPARQHARLVSLAHLLVPYRREATVERGISVTREVLRAIVNLARGRGATPLIVIPVFGPDDPAEQTLRRRIVDDTLPHVVISVDADWRLAWDRHPNARATHAMATAIAARLSP